MPRTSITINSVPAFLAGTTLSQTIGDAANDMSLDLSYAPKLHLYARNNNAGSVDYTIELPAGGSNFNQTQTISVTHAPATVRMFVIDLPSDLAQSGNVLHIDSADANFGDMRFRAFTWTDTPNAGGGSRYRG